MTSLFWASELVETRFARQCKACKELRPLLAKRKLDKALCWRKPPDSEAGTFKQDQGSAAIALLSKSSNIERKLHDAVSKQEMIKKQGLFVLSLVTEKLA